jgi:hypothetical protein
MPSHARPPAASIRLCLALAGLGGCTVNMFDGKDIVYREVSAFTALDDTTLAVQIRAYKRGGSLLGSMSGSNSEEWIAYALIDTKRRQIRKAVSLPKWTAGALPRFFFGCDGGSPVSRHPEGLAGPIGTCYDESLMAASSGAGYAAYDRQYGAGFLLFDPQFHPIDSIPGFRVLELDENRDAAITVEWRSYTSDFLWRRLSLQSAAPLDSAALKDPVEVRVVGAGTRLVCTDTDKAVYPQACWLPEGVPGFADAARRDCVFARCEWSPISRRLLRLENMGRFVASALDGSREDTLETGPLVDRFNP